MVVRRDVRASVVQAKHCDALQWILVVSVARWTLLWSLGDPSTHTVLESKEGVNFVAVHLSTSETELKFYAF